MLEAVELFKSFKASTDRAQYPLLGASLTVDEGEKIGILGRSGEGKSTFASILCGFLKPDSGNVYLDECPLYNGKNRVYDRKLGNKIQLIPQQAYSSFDPVRTVGSSVEEVVRVNGRGISAAQARSETARLFEAVGLDGALMRRLPAQLSGGQVQKAAIARAIAMNPVLIVSDEATAMLDASSQAQIIDIFDKLVSERGISILFISHNQSLVNSFADKIYSLKDGIFERIR